MDRFAWNPDPESRTAALAAWQESWETTLAEPCRIVEAYLALGGTVAWSERRTRIWLPDWSAVQVYVEHGGRVGRRCWVQVNWIAPWGAAMFSRRTVALSLRTPEYWEEAVGGFMALSAWCAEQAAALVTQ